MPKKANHNVSNNNAVSGNAAGTALASADNGKLINSIKVSPYNQLRILLGDYTAQNPPKGFEVELTPDPEPADSFSSEVISTGSPEQYRLMLHLANNGDTPVTATVYHM